MNFYIIVEEDTNICKIGVSIDIEERLKSLQTGNSNKLLLNSGFYCKVPYKLETIVKNKYKEYNRIGEWFNIEDLPALKDFIRCRAHDLNNKYYTCDLCNFKTLYKTGYKRHLKTDKHNKKENFYIQTDTITSVIQKKKVEIRNISGMIEIIHGKKEMLFKCRKCEKEFKRKWDIERHLIKRKKTCKKTCKKVIPNIPIYSNIFQEPSKIFHNLPYSSINDESIETNEKRFGCDFCKRSYKHNYNLTKHLKTCKEKQKEDKKQKQKELDLVNAKIRLLELEKSMINNTTNNNTTNNTNSHNTNTNTNTFNLVYNDYGHEDMKFFKSSERYKKILNSFLRNGMFGLQQYIKYKYCNPKQPENLTIKYSNQRSNELKIRNANKWESKNKKEIMDHIYDRDTNVEEILQIYEEINGLVDDENMDEIQVNFLNNVDELYDDENQIELKKLKTSTLKDFYNCYKSNQQKYKISPKKNKIN